MHVLYFSPRNIWPCNGGAPIRDYYLSRELARLGAVHFFGITHRDDRVAPPPDSHFTSITLVPKGPSYTPWRLLRGAVGPVPVTVLNYFDAGVAAELHRVLRQHAFDVVQVEGIHLAQYLPIIRSAAPSAAVVCDWHDIESELMSRYGSYVAGWIRRRYARRTAALLRRMEVSLLAQCDFHLAVSEREKASLQTMLPQARVEIVENGVDVESFAPIVAARKAAEAAGEESRHDVVFVGTMDFHANIDGARWFALEVWPKIRARNERLRLLLVGARPVPEVLALKKLPGVVVTGTVDDIRPYYCEALTAIVPLRIGGGTRLKILEAMAAGVPVISTPLGAEGLAVRSGVEIMLAAAPEEMAAAVLNLQGSQSARQRLAEAGRNLVHSRYDWPVIGRSLAEIYRAMCRDQVHV